MKKAFIFFLLLIQFILSQQIPEIKVPYIKGNVKIDGVLEEECWNKAEEITDFIITWTSQKERYGQKPKNKTVGYIFYDIENLYIGVECYDEDIKNLRIDKMQERDKGWGDDCVEIFIDPGLTKRRFFQYIINSKGIVYDQKSDRGENIVDWDSGFEYGIKVGKDKWVVEIKIPFAELELKENTGIDWGFNITRFEPREWIVQSWGPVFGGNLQPEKFGIIRDIKIDYLRYRIECDLISWGNLYIGDDHIEISLKNLSKNQLKLIGEIYIDNKLLNKKAIELKPEETKRTTLNYKIEKGNRKLVFWIKDQKGKAIYLMTKYLKLPDTYLNIKPEVPIYYLSDKNLIAELEIFVGRDSIGKAEVVFEVYDEKGNLKISKNIKGLKQSREKVPIEIKGLREGRYVLKSILKFDKKTIEEKKVEIELVKGPFD